MDKETFMGLVDLAKQKLDEQNVQKPIYRCMRFIGRDNKLHTITIDQPIPKDVFDQMQDATQKLFAHRVQTK